MKREGASTLFIHGFPWALSYLFRSLDLLLQLFEIVLCVVLKVVWECSENVCVCLKIARIVCKLIY